MAATILTIIWKHQFPFSEDHDDQHRHNRGDRNQVYLYDRGDQVAIKWRSSGDQVAIKWRSSGDQVAIQNLMETTSETIETISCSLKCISFLDLHHLQNGVSQQGGAPSGTNTKFYLRSTKV